jgi:hypothetical protein
MLPYLNNQKTNNHNMKKTVITTIATLGITVGAFAQGSLFLSDADIGPGVALSGANQANPAQSAFFSGSLEIQVWFENSTTDANGISAINANINSGTYKAPDLTNYKEEADITGIQVNSGTFTYSQNSGSVALPDAPTSGTGTFVLIGIAGSSEGAIAFQNATGGNPNIVPPGNPANPDGWDGLGQNLVLSATPEPSTIALGGIGAASLLLFRRRK